MLKTLIFSSLVGILATCISSPWFWRNLVSRKTVYADETHIGFCRKKSPYEIIKYQISNFIPAIIGEWFVLNYLSGPIIPIYTLGYIMLTKDADISSDYISYQWTEKRRLIFRVSSILSIGIVGYTVFAVVIKIFL